MKVVSSELHFQVSSTAFLKIRQQEVLEGHMKQEKKREGSVMLLVPAVWPFLALAMR